MSNRSQVKRHKLTNKLDEILAFAVRISSSFIAIAYLLLVFCAEELTVVGKNQSGLFLHCVGLIGLLLYASRQHSRKMSGFWLALSLVSLTRILNTSMPLALFQAVYRYVVIGIPLFIAVYLVIHLGGINRQMAGLIPGKLLIQILVGISGFGIGYIEFLILHPAPMINTLRWDLFIVAGIILLIFTGFLEELLFRGIFLKTAFPHLGRNSLFYVAMIYSILRVGNLSVLDMIFALIVGLFFGWIVGRYKSILGVTIAHSIANIMLYLVIPFF